MKVSALALAAFAATALATPTSLKRTDTEPPASCSNNQQPVCCASLLGLTCLIDILGGTCSGGSYCCDAGGSVGGLISLSLLNCVDIL